jgi:hypothetical protein
LGTSISQGSCHSFSSFVAPEITGDKITLTFVLTVSDGKAKARDPLQVTIEAAKPAKDTKDSINTSDLSDASKIASPQQQSDSDKNKNKNNIHQPSQFPSPTNINDTDLENEKLSTSSVNSKSIIGTEGDDNLIGTTGNDNIHAKSGNDVIDAKAGNDKVFGDKGNDIINGNSGNDNLYGNLGDDILTGGSGKDFFSCGSGEDRVVDFKKSEGDKISRTCELKGPPPQSTGTLIVKKHVINDNGGTKQASDFTIHLLVPFDMTLTRVIPLIILRQMINLHLRG